MRGGERLPSVLPGCGLPAGLSGGVEDAARLRRPAVPAFLPFPSSGPRRPLRGGAAGSPG